MYPRPDLYYVNLSVLLVVLAAAWKFAREVWKLSEVITMIRARMDQFADRTDVEVLKTRHVNLETQVRSLWHIVDGNRDVRAYTRAERMSDEEAESA